MATNPNPYPGAPPFKSAYMDPAIAALPTTRVEPQYDGSNAAATVPGPINVGQVIPTPVPARSGSTTLGEIKVYDPAAPDGTTEKFTPAQSAAENILAGADVPLPNKPFWPIKKDDLNISRPLDPYAAGGMTGPFENANQSGQDYLANVGISDPQATG
jgi:hypothetical protein